MSTTERFYWRKWRVILISVLSPAEAHAADDRSDAGPDEDEVRRVRAGAGKKHVVSPRPVHHTHTHVCIHTRRPGPSTFIHPSIHPRVEEHVITTLFLLQKHPSIHQLFWSLSLMLFLHISRPFWKFTCKSRIELHYWIILYNYFIIIHQVEQGKMSVSCLLMIIIDTSGYVIFDHSSTF